MPRSENMTATRGGQRAGRTWQRDLGHQVGGGSLFLRRSKSLRRLITSWPPTPRNAQFDLNLLGHDIVPCHCNTRTPLWHLCYFYEVLNVPHILMLVKYTLVSNWLFCLFSSSSSSSIALSAATIRSWIIIKICIVVYCRTFDSLILSRNQT